MIQLPATYPIGVPALSHRNHRWNPILVGARDRNQFDPCSLWFDRRNPADRFTRLFITVNLLARLRKRQCSFDLIFRAPNWTNC